MLSVLSITRIQSLRGSCQKYRDTWIKYCKGILYIFGICMLKGVMYRLPLQMKRRKKKNHIPS